MRTRAIILKFPVRNITPYPAAVALLYCVEICVFVLFLAQGLLIKKIKGKSQRNLINVLWIKQKKKLEYTEKRNTFPFPSILPPELLCNSSHEVWVKERFAFSQGTSTPQKKTIIIYMYYEFPGWE